jgi:hypothetical protein
MQGIDLMCSMPVVIFGAGATKACGGPLTAEILPRAFECEAELGREDFFLTLDGFLIENFHVPENHGARQADHYPALPLLISLIDTAIDRKHSFGANWPVDRLMEGLTIIIEPSWTNLSVLPQVRRSWFRSITTSLRTIR